MMDEHATGPAAARVDGVGLAPAALAIEPQCWDYFRASIATLTCARH